MRLAIISDPHANALALSALTDVLDGADRVVCLGDMVGYYCQVNETIELLRRYEPLCLLGNHDYYLLNGCSKDLSESVQFGVHYAQSVITPEHRRWLSSLPHVWGGELGGLSCLFFHGSPWSPMTHYLYADNHDLPKLDEFDFDLLAFGQTHRCLSRFGKRPALINPGSVGQSRDKESYGQACAVVLDTETLQCQSIVRPYDMQSVVDQALANGAGDWARKFLPVTTATLSS